MAEPVGRGECECCGYETELKDYGPIYQAATQRGPIKLCDICAGSPAGQLHIQWVRYQVDDPSRHAAAMTAYAVNLILEQLANDAGRELVRQLASQMLGGDVLTREVLADYHDRNEQVRAIARGWELQRITLLITHDEEGIEGWRWIDGEHREHDKVGAWDELPPWPDSAREALQRELRS